MPDEDGTEADADAEAETTPLAEPDATPLLDEPRELVEPDGRLDALFVVQSRSLRDDVVRCKLALTLSEHEMAAKVATATRPRMAAGRRRREATSVVRGEQTHRTANRGERNKCG